MRIVYLDEFGHIGPFISRDDAKYKTHPVFGFGGFCLPAEKVRSFGSFFQSLKSDLLAWEISRSGVHPGRWEKKGSSLMTTANIERYPEVTKAIKRILARLDKDGGQVFFYGQVKPLGATTDESSRNRYDHVMIQTIKRLGWADGRHGSTMIILDEVDDNSRLEAMAAASGFMFGSRDGRHLIEPPMQVESHLYPTVQCADWICGLLGRVTAYLSDPVQYADYGWAHRIFGERLASVSISKSKVHCPIDSTRSFAPRDLIPLTTARPQTL